MQDLFTHFGPACSSPPMHRRRLSEGAAFSFPDTVLTTTLFLGDLPVLCTEVGLRELFSQYGDVERVQLKKSDRDPQRAHLGFGFVKFTTRASAERALEELNGKFFLGRALRVGWADDHNRVGAGTKASDPKKNHQTAQLHVSFTTRNPNKIVSEMDLGGVFSGFGNVVDIAIKKNVLNRESGVQSGYAFVHFSLTLAGLESALSAADQVNNCTIDEITYKCKTDQALLMQYLSLKTPKPIITHDLSCNSDYRSESVSPIERSNSVENKSRPVPFTLNFSTYGNTVEPQTIYSFPSLSDDSFVSPRSSDNRRHHKQEIYYPSSSSSPVSRSSSSIRENDYNRSQELYLSLSSSMSYDEYPSYRRGGMMM